jgi:hypothetical protein
MWEPRRGLGSLTSCVAADGFCGGDEDCCDAALGCNSYNRCAAEPDPGGGDTCLELTEDCLSDKACCSGACVEGACGETVACVAAFGACDSELDCCSGRCLDDGTCAASCVPIGRSCTADRDCCSGLCGAEGSCVDGV